MVTLFSGCVGAKGKWVVAGDFLSVPPILASQAKSHTGWQGRSVGGLVCCTSEKCGLILLLIVGETWRKGC